MRYNYDCFNDVEEVVLDTTHISDWDYQFPQTFGAELTSTGINVYFKTKIEVYRRLAKEIKKPIENINEKGTISLLSFASDIAIENPEWLL